MSWFRAFASPGLRVPVPSRKAFASSAFASLAFASSSLTRLSRAWTLRSSSLARAFASLALHLLRGSGPPVGAGGLFTHGAALARFALGAKGLSTRIQHVIDANRYGGKIDGMTAAIGVEPRRKAGPL